MNQLVCHPCGAGLERVRYFPRQLLTADDMLVEDQYFRQKLRRHNRFLHGWGVVCGLEVTAAPTETLPWRVKVSAGYALSPQGDEIYESEPACLDLLTCLQLVGDPCEPGQPPKPIPPKSGKVYVAIRYAECETRPVRVHPLGCGCEDTLCEYSRIRDDYEIACLPEPPKSDPVPLLCDWIGRKQIPPCQPCPENTWVVLAEVTLPDKLETPINDSAIDNLVRRQLYSTAVLQAQLIECCCQPPPPPVVDADVAITKTSTVNQDTRLIQYVITVHNNGPAIAKKVVVVDNPPKNIILAQGFSASQGAWTVMPPKNPPFRAELGDLPVGATVTLRYAVRASTDGGAYVNTAQVSSDSPDPKLGNNKATDTKQLPQVIF